MQRRTESLHTHTDPPHIPYHTHSFAMSIRIATLPLATVLVCTTFSTVLAKPLYAPALDRTVRQVTRVSDPADELTGDNDRDSDPNGSGDRPTDRPETQPTPAPTRVPTFPSPGNRCIRVSANQPGNAYNTLTRGPGRGQAAGATRPLGIRPPLCPPAPPTFPNSKVPGRAQTTAPTTAPAAPPCGFASLHTYATFMCADGQSECAKLMGPAVESIQWSLPIVLTAGHGGSLGDPDVNDNIDNFYPDRVCTPQNGYLCSSDGYTIELTQEIAHALGSQNNGKCPWVVVNYLHRIKLDANRDLPEASGGNANAAIAHAAYHDLIFQAQEKVNALHGNDGSGVNGVLFDIHGYKGEKYNGPSSTVGAPMVHYGQGISESSYDTDPIANSKGGTVTHAKNRVGSAEMIHRGVNSMGGLVPQVSPNLLQALPASQQTCGLGLASPTLRFPNLVCTNAGNPSASDCNFFAGGYTVQEHEEDAIPQTTIDFNNIQVEVPQCIRNAEEFFNAANAVSVAIRADWAAKFATGACAWVANVFGQNNGC
eukprot:m.166931 g.166931  ORF g.166931 m.166931 type:complete len:539 (-) comp12761_c0_seq1:1047-2663(-)